MTKLNLRTVLLYLGKSVCAVVMMVICCILLKGKSL